MRPSRLLGPRRPVHAHSPRDRRHRDDFGHTSDSVLAATVTVIVRADGGSVDCDDMPSLQYTAA